MADSASAWHEVVSAIMDHPEKGELLLVLLAGAWRWLKELWRESKDDKSHETLVEILMRENRELRDELRKERQEDDRKDHDNHQ